MISTCLSAVLVCSFMLACNPEKARSRDKPAESGIHELSVVVNGLERTSLVHVPAGYKPQIPLPLVIMLHGGGGTAKAAAWETEWTVEAASRRVSRRMKNSCPPSAGRSWRRKGQRPSKP